MNRRVLGHAVWGIPAALLLATVPSWSTATPTAPAGATPRGTAVATVPAAARTLPAGDEREYLGAKKCRTCHLAEYNSWRKTRMAQAFELLKPGVRAEAKEAAGLDPNADYTSDAGCLSCHTTGYGDPSGFKDIKSTPDLAGVACEACHGPGSKYAVDELMSLKNKNHSFESVIAAGLVYPVPESVCQRCHNADSPHNPSVDPKYAFDYTDRVNKGTHKHIKLKYKHGPLPAGVLFQQQRP